MMRILLLPGLDGTGRLFARFSACLPGWLEPEVVGYPRDRAPDLDALVSLAEERIERGVRHAVLAESVSGPVGIRYAVRRREDVTALVLCASFVRNPLPRALSGLPRLANRSLLSLPVPGPLVRAFLAGPRAPGSDVREVKAALRGVGAGALAARIRSLARIDVAEDLRRLSLPVLYLLASRDRLVGERGAEQVRRALPAVEVRRLDGPHLVLQARPRESADLVARFLEPLRPGRERRSGAEAP